MITRNEVFFTVLMAIVSWNLMQRLYERLRYWYIMKYRRNQDELPITGYPTMPYAIEWPSKKTLDAWTEEQIAKFLLDKSFTLASPIRFDVKGISDDVQQECLHRCGEVIVIAGSYKDRTREQLIDAMQYLDEWEIAYTK